MKKPTVKLFIRIRVDGVQKYAKPGFSPNHALRPLWAWVDGTQEHHAEAVYVLRYRGISGRRVWETVGKDASVALAAKIRKEKEQAVRQGAAETGLKVTGGEGVERIRLADAVAL